MTDVKVGVRYVMYVCTYPGTATSGSIYVYHNKLYLGHFLLT